MAKTRLKNRQNQRFTFHRRKKIWSIYDGWICSVLGACIRRSELRQMARKKQFGLDSEASDYLLHSALVNQVNVRSTMSRAINKMLDKKFRMHINRYTKVKDDLEIKELWEEDIRTGNVPGAYWAIMTHPIISEELQGLIYGQVHMMGHDTHGDYQRDDKLLANLKERVAVLEEVLGSERHCYLKEKKQQQKEISSLVGIEQQYLALKAENRHLQSLLDKNDLVLESTVFKRELETLRQHNATLCGRIDELTVELEEKNEMHEIARNTLENIEKINGQLQAEKEELQQEIITFEGSLVMNMAVSCGCASCEDHDTDRCPGHDLCGKTVLYVGGRQSLVPMYRQLVEGFGGQFLHHDGGIETARAKLPKMLNSADMVLCPVDCVSHDACNCVKKICKRYQKPFAMMRSSGLSSLTKGLSEIVQ